MLLRPDGRGAIVISLEVMYNVKLMSAILTTTAFGALAAFGPACQAAFAQEAPPDVQPHVASPADDPMSGPNCGSWQTGTWVSNGSCGPTDYRGRVAGTITIVKGHLVTIQQTAGTLVINDQPALDDKRTGRVAVGRSITAVGFWKAGVFYATHIV